MAASMAILAGTVSTGQEDPETGAPVLGNAAGITATVMLFVFNTFFGMSNPFNVLRALADMRKAIGWLGMTWLYPAEITSLRIRIQANALATCSNWLSNFVIVMITPPVSPEAILTPSDCEADHCSSPDLRKFGLPNIHHLRSAEHSDYTCCVLLLP